MVMQRVMSALRSFSVLVGVAIIPSALAIPVNPNPFQIDLIQAEPHEIAPGEKVHIIAHWKLAEGYHAYVEQFNVVSASPQLGSARLQDIRKVIDFFDKVSGQRRQGVVGTGELFIEFDASKSATSGKQNVEIDVTYQACAEDHCLLPKTIRANFEVKISGAPALSLLGRSISLDDWRIWLLVFFAGVLTSLTPCIFPLIPITLAVIGSRQEGRSKRASFFLSLSYVLGIALTYSILGVVAALTGSLFGSLLGHPLVAVALALVFSVLALSLLGWYAIETPSFLTHRLMLHKTQHGWLGAFMAGNIAGIVASPCVGPVLAGLLAYVAQTQNALHGFGLMFVFALGMGQLLLLLGTFSSLQKRLPRSGPWMELVKITFALAFFALAGFYVKSWLTSEGLWRLAGLAVLIALIRPEQFEQWRKQKFALKIKFLVQWLAVAVALGLIFWGTPRWNSSTVQENKSYQTLPFMPFSQEAIAQAAAAKKAVLIDFYADWCVACKELEIETFSAESVQALKDKYVFLKFDATKPSAAFEALQKQYGIVGLPHLVIYDQQGVWRKELTLTGFESAEEFSARLKRALGGAR